MIYNNHLTISIYRVHKDYVDFLHIIQDNLLHFTDLFLTNFKK